MDTIILSFQIRVPFIGLRGRILVNLYWKTFRQKVLKNTEEFLMQDVLKEEGGKGNHFEIPPADFLSDVDCAKKRRLASLPFGIMPNRRFYSMSCQTRFL